MGGREVRCHWAAAKLWLATGTCGRRGAFDCKERSAPRKLVPRVLGCLVPCHVAVGQIEHDGPRPGSRRRTAYI